tara:strand:+ start:1047 stop:1667 length:621 start_codon:yes stop_codon:yes gene_type:complete
MIAIILDTETTGLPKEWNKSITDDENWPNIVQLAWILYDLSTNELLSCKNFIIKLRDGKKIPQDSTNIHKITNEIMDSSGIDIQIVFDKFFEDFDKAEYVVAHNLDFDWKIMSIELYRNKIYHRINLTKQKKIRYCTMKRAKNLYRFRDEAGKLTKKYPKLKQLYELLYHEKVENLHNAAVDTYICFRCFYKMFMGQKSPKLTFMF